MQRAALGTPHFTPAPTRLGAPGPSCPFSLVGHRVLQEKTVSKRGAGEPPTMPWGRGLPLPQRRPQTWHLLFNLYLQTPRSDMVPETLDAVIGSPCPSPHFWGCHSPASAPSHPAPTPNRVARLLSLSFTRTCQFRVRDSSRPPLA